MDPTQPEPCPQVVGGAVRWAASRLAASGAGTPRLDAELLLGHILGLERTQVLTRRNVCLTADQVARFAALVHRRAQHEPVAYLIGERAFYDITLHVSPDVLIPRPETEHLIEAALAWARARGGSMRVADVGTGSGAMAIVLARHLPEAQVWAIDISWAALHVARRNLRRYRLDERVQLVQADLLSPMGEPIDLIVANLPYIDSGEVATLEPNVALYEPHLALDGGAGGIEVMARLVEQLPACLAPTGLALLELDPHQAIPMQAVARHSLPDADLSLVRDYAGLERVLRIERLGG